MHKIIGISMALLVFMSTGTITLAQNQTGKYFTDENNVAINGYDLITYFTKAEAIRGSIEYSTDFDGVTYYFSSADNLAMFKEAPEKYLPKYGGFCAFGISKAGKKFGVDPTSFKLIDGELYLFFNDFVQGKPLNSKVEWNKDEKNQKILAEKNWKKIQENG